MANPQPDQFTRLSNELYEAIIKTDFSKRQRNIVDLIVRLSYGCKKKFAILRPSDFEVVGVLRGHIKKELEILQEANVLHISGEIFTLNKDYESWQVSLTKTFTMEKFQKILARNLDQNVTETVTKVTEMVTSHYSEPVTEIVTTVTDSVTSVTEMVTVNPGENITELPKQEHMSYQNSNTSVTEMVTGTCLEPLQGAASRAPKDIIKDIIKDSSTKLIELNQGTEEAAAASEFPYPRIYQIYEQHFTRNGRVTEFEVEDLGALFDQYGGEWVYKAMREAAKYQVMTLAYITKVLKGFDERGTPDKDEQKSAGTVHQLYQVVDDDPITRMLREVNQTHAANGAT